MTDAEMKEWLETQYDVNEKACWVWKGYKSRGYGYVRWKGTWKLVHRVYWLLSGRNIPESFEMCHGHGCSKACFNPEHLKPGTPSENQADRIRDGTDGRGEKCPTAKLTNEQVLAIRKNLTNKTGRELAKEFGVSDNTISSIMLKKTWKYI
jgi:hypothetical protein